MFKNFQKCQQSKTKVHHRKSNTICLIEREVYEIITTLIENKLDLKPPNYDPNTKTNAVHVMTTLSERYLNWSMICVEIEEKQG